MTRQMSCGRVSMHQILAMGYKGAWWLELGVFQDEL